MHNESHSPPQLPAENKKRSFDLSPAPSTNSKKVYPTQVTASGLDDWVGPRVLSQKTWTALMLPRFIDIEPLRHTPDWSSTSPLPECFCGADETAADEALCGCARHRTSAHGAQCSMHHASCQRKDQQTFGPTMVLSPAWNPVLFHQPTAF